MSLDREQVYRRKMEFRDLIDLVDTNPIVYHCVEAYAHGTIVTKEEAFCQMVRQLASTREEAMRRLEQEMSMRAIPVIRP